ncbi:hypothetical protein OMK64_11635, partial [Cellulomonas fimi]|uniref:hypothetical protein n=1 Tax=Cellulomonas fimi TaxID=1708 RepID=UPI00234D465C
GGGITSPLDVTVGNDRARTITLTSEYSWLYNQYPFTNDPDAGEGQGDDDEHGRARRPSSCARGGEGERGPHGSASLRSRDGAAGRGPGGHTVGT